MERMAGKVAGDRQFEEMGGVGDRSIDCESTVYAYPGKLTA